VSARRAALAALALALLAPGCSEDPRTRHGYVLQVPAGWRPWSAPTPPIVPGDVLEAYEVPGGGSLVVFRSPYTPETTAEQLLTATRYLVLNLPSLEIRSARVIEVAGKPAAFLELTADGIGKALSPTGLGKPVPPAGEQNVRTRRNWLRVPRGAAEGMIEVFFHAPESEYAGLEAAWNGVLGSLRV
jgi:hypothetical protein